MNRKIIQIGSSAGVTIPQSVREDLNLEVGQEVVVDVDEDTGDIRIRTRENKSERDERIARRTMDFIDRYRSDLEALADK